MQIRNIVLVIILSILTSSCALWPYKRDFNCPIPEGEGCLSLHEVMRRADAGVYEGGDQESSKNVQSSKKTQNSKNRPNKQKPKKDLKNSKTNKSIGYCHAC